MATEDNLRDRAKEIRGAFEPSSVTNEAVGGLLLDIINFFIDYGGNGGGGGKPDARYWSKEELKMLDQYLYVLNDKIKALYADSAGDSELFKGHKWEDYFDKPVKTDSDVIHNSVTAKSLVEEDNPGNENVVSTRLVETGGTVDGGFLGDLGNVSGEADTAEAGSILVKEMDVWSPVYPAFSEVRGYDNLVMPVFNTLTKSWQFIAVPSGGVIPPVTAGFPYTFPIVLS